jgi:hypothetical protein
MRSFWAVLAVGTIFLTPLASAAAAEAGGAIAAVWKEQHIIFSYLGRTARYSCQGLRDKVGAMLIELGVRRDLQITALGCEGAAAGMQGAALGPSLGLVFSAPALPDAAAKPLHAGDLAAVDARFEAFTLTHDAFRNMDIADCELVEQFAQQILPKLAARHVTQDITCVPLQRSGGRFLVRGEILMPLPSR